MRIDSLAEASSFQSLEPAEPSICDQQHHASLLTPGATKVTSFDFT